MDGVSVESGEIMKPINQSKYIKRFLEGLRTNDAREACFCGKL